MKNFAKNNTQDVIKDILEYYYSKIENGKRSYKGFRTLAEKIHNQFQSYRIWKGQNDKYQTSEI